MGKGKEILKTDIKREKEMLYYCGTDEKTGNITVCCVKMSRKGPGTKKAREKKKTTTKKKK